ncbi:MAG TPA: nucleotide sugar dehydrogenase [Thermoanaerobaculia bacterium]|nr:nucleotide sugar dehydrogenase [Thermoanaerobaculia bacterium]
MSSGETKIGVVGLGYVGLPVAVAMGSQYPVVGFDIQRARIDELCEGRDSTREVSSKEIASAGIRFTDDPTALRDCNFIIIAVPTPVDRANRPDLRALTAASQTVGEQLSPGAIVVFESTVYPGVTEEICLPILEERSGLRAPRDFQVGYSPERINPGDREHTFTRIQKVVAGQTEEAAEVIARIYGSVIEQGIHLAPSIRVAEAAKVIENTQRDLNIALMNELALIFHRMGIDSGDVLAAAGTKWNFLRFTPGLVGGHCIGVDPFFLTHKAEELGYHPQVILAGRRINDGMGDWIVDQLLLELVQQGSAVRESRVAILGITFKENVPDMRNSGVLRILAKLRRYGLGIRVHDPLADPREAREMAGIDLEPLDRIRGCQAMILAVPHRELVEQGWQLAERVLENGQGVVMDVRGVLDRNTRPSGINLWRL